MCVCVYVCLYAREEERRRWVPNTRRGAVERGGKGERNGKGERKSPGASGTHAEKEVAKGARPKTRRRDGAEGDEAMIRARVQASEIGRSAERGDDEEK